LSSFTKDPADILDYGIDWSSWLAPLEDTITTSTWSVPTGLSKGAESKSTTASTVWLSGGTAGEVYKVANKIVTAGGRTAERSITIKVKEL